MTLQGMDGVLVPGIYVFLRLVVCGIWFGQRAGLHLVERSSRIVLYGLLLNLLPAVGLCALGIWTPIIDFAAWLAISALAAAWSWRQRGCRQPHIESIKAAALLLPVIVCALFIPMRSEWLVGGWDPGLYQTTAVQIARGNGTTPFAHAVYRKMDSEQRQRLSRQENGYHEIMPGVPITIDDGALHHYFFPLTPVWGAWLYRCGGLALLTRAAVIAAFLGTIPLAALLFGLFGGMRAVCVGLMFLFVSPMWWYHQGVPTSELLQLCILLGGMAEYLSVRRLRIAPWGLGVFAFALTINRFSDPPLVGVLLFFAGIGEAWSEKKDGFDRRWLSVCTGLAAGILWILAFYPMTIFRLQEKDAALSIVLAAFLIVAFGALLAHRWVPVKCAGFLRKTLGVAAAGLWVGTGALAIPPLASRILQQAESVPWLFDIVNRYGKLLAYHGVFFCLLAISGAVWSFLYYRNTNSGRNITSIVVAGLLAVCALLLMNPGIAALYPWALRRYLVFAIPLFVITQSAVVLWAGTGWRCSWWERGMKGLVLMVAIGAVLSGGRISIEAVRASDYSGMITVLAQFEAALAPEDIVIADDARWATPLLLVLGRDVIDGSRIWKKSDAEAKLASVTKILQIGAETGRRVVWVSSTERGLDLYGEGLAGKQGREIGEAIDYAYPTVIHSPRATVYVSRENHRTFRLWVLGD